MWWLLLLLVVVIDAKIVWSVPNVTNPEEFARMNNLIYVTSVGSYSVFHGTRKRNTIPIANMVEETKRRHFKRVFTRTSDPLFPQQWHLRTIGLHPTATGQGVHIAIVDDGVEFAHPDLAANFNAALSYDYNHNQANVNPYRDDGHGTSAAGSCCAAANNICGRGVAHKAQIVGIRLISEPAYDYQEAQALIHKKDQIPIYSCSWGPEDSGNQLSGPGRITHDVLWTPRIYVWASGNGRQNLDNCNYDGYANHPNIIAIGAVDHTGQRAYYSEGGACLFAVAPSSGAGEGISTTDLMGWAGYDRGECTNNFGGTSAAAPIAAGVFALMLEVRPQLTSRDIQHIVAKGKTHNHETGFGLLETGPLIELAKTHTLVGPQKTLTVGPLDLHGARIPDDGGSWFTHTVTIPQVPFIERFAITVTMTHGRRGQVLLRFGDSVLSEHRGDPTSGRSTWTYTTVHEWGKNATQWQFKARDDTRDAWSGTLESIIVTIYYI